MAKDTFYFTHDYNSRTDEKIKLLIRRHGMTGYGIFWSIIEDLYNNANALRTDYEGIAFDLHSNELIVKSIINDFELFSINGEYFGSLSIERRLNERSLKSEKARESASYRWNKRKTDTNALQIESERNAIKERKGKDIKESKENKEEDNANKLAARSKEFEKSLIPYIGTYSKEMIREFADYWTEPNKSKTKMLFEMKPTWDTSKRLATWARNDFSKKQYKHPSTQKLPSNYDKF
jgi:hypothetical protein